MDIRDLTRGWDRNGLEGEGSYGCGGGGVAEVVGSEWGFNNLL